MMVDFANNGELKKISFETKMYQLDSDINQIISDIKNSNNPEVIYKHFERVQNLVESYRELALLSGIELDINYNQRFMESLAALLFDKYCEMI